MNSALQCNVRALRSLPRLRTPAGPVARVVVRGAKDDAAKKALKEMFEGKKDYLAAYDRPPPGSGGGDGGGDGGGKGPFGGFNFGEWFDGFKANMGGFLKTVASVCVLLLAIVVVNNLHYAQKLLKIIFRLDGGPRRLTSQPALAPAQSEEVAAGNITQGEADLMAKYGGGTDDVYTGDDGQDAE